MSTGTHYNTFLFWTDKTKMEMSGHKEWCHLGWNHAPHINLVPPLRQYDVGVRILACFSTESAHQSNHELLSSSKTLKSQM